MANRSHQNFTDIENNVLNYMKEHQDGLKQMTIQKLADDTFTSKSTIFRLAKKLGFNGFTDMIYHLSKQPSQVEDDSVSDYVASLSDGIQEMFMQNQTQLEALMTRIQNKNRTLYIIGTGYSGIIGEYLYKKILGKGELVYYSNGADSNTLFINNLHRITDIICISKSGETALVNGKVQLAKAEGIGIISFTHSADNSLASLSDIPFVIADDQFLDQNNISQTQFYAMLMLYLEYTIEKSF